MLLKRNSLLLVSGALLALSAPALAETKFDGVYVGVIGSVQLHNSRNAVTEGTTAFLGLPDTVAPESLRLDNNDGWRGGAVAGWNGSSGSLVYGLEADVSFGANRAGAAFSGAAIPDLAPNGLTTSASRRIGTQGSLRARLGTTVGENVLLYGTGGVALADVRGTAGVVVNGAPTVAWSGERSQGRFGWTIGAGTEFKLTDGVSLRAEYLYTDLGRQSVLATGNSGVRAISALNGVDYQVGLPTAGGAARVGIIARF
ncbi:outer membrane protein [Sandarakinorhabdus rubra]|uniref:outer membrane protein n=1 Tax=Sandarakinorhabdus rubra TaxID=2672568 RepID=UPI0013D9C8E4|nr:outer membrane beta-barrel protein [Sandarakinorhabdus rubra]